MASDPIELLVHDTVRLTGAPLPALLDNESLALSVDAQAGGFYLIGLIGGKDVGKSSLASAIAGVTLGTPSNTGEGTRDAIAYVHRDVENAVGELLDSVVPGRFMLVTHDHASLAAQVFVDLPDIDSKYDDHIDLTRRVLRHLLYPIFIQSIEKYADQRPQQLLAQVAEGNDPANFIFCLNKVDQLVSREGEPASVVLAEDYARRLTSLLHLPESPRIYRISAAQPDRFDLPTLRTTLGRQRNALDVRRSMDLAVNRRQHTFLRWLDAQNLAGRLEQASRVLNEAQERADERLLTPLQSRVIPRLLDDPLLKAQIVEQASRRRLARWPVVNVIDGVLGPMTSMFRRNVLGSMSCSRQSVGTVLSELTPSVAARVRTLFADLRRRDPAIVPLYDTTPPWSDEASEQVSADLATRLSDALDARQQRITEQAGKGHGTVTAPVRWLMTWGAIVWFPIVQPILEIVLNPDYTWAGMSGHAIWQLVRLLGTTYLLTSVSFLAIYFVLLWAILRFTTGRSTQRLMDKIDANESTDLAGQASAWVDDLLSPLEARTADLSALVERIAAVRHRAA
jgi:hypothetical protein